MSKPSAPKEVVAELLARGDFIATDLIDELEDELQQAAPSAVPEE